MGKKDKNKKKGKGAEKTAMKTDKKLAAKQKKLLEKIGEADIAEVVFKLEADEARLKTVTETVCPPPSPRSSFTLISHPDKEELVLFGGEFFNGDKICIYNDLFFYNIGKNEWKQLRSPSGPTPRSGHQMVSVANDGGQLWLFGGEHASPSQTQFYHYKDLWVMGLKLKKWEKINAPNGPSPRSGHRMVTAKKKLIVFGGFHDNNQSYKYYNDVHMFSLETYTWLKFEVSGVMIPSPRSACCMSANADGRVLVWGGYSKTKIKKNIDGGITHTDMYSLVPDKINTNDKFKWNTIKPAGYKLPPRSNIGCTTAHNGKIYCFGGVMDIDEDEEDVRGQFGEDLVVLDMNTHTWRLLEIKKKSKSTNVEGTDDIPMKSNEKIMEANTSVSTDGIFTITVAGSNSSATDLPKVPSLFPKHIPRNTPSPRMNPSMCVCKGILYLFGGIYEDDNKQFTYNDFYALDLHKMNEWKVLIPNNENAHEWVESDSESDSEESGSEDSDSTDDESNSDMEIE